MPIVNSQPHLHLLAAFNKGDHAFLSTLSFSSLGTLLVLLFLHRMLLPTPFSTNDSQIFISSPNLSTEIQTLICIRLIIRETPPSSFLPKSASIVFPISGNSNFILLIAQAKTSWSLSLFFVLISYIHSISKSFLALLTKYIQNLTPLTTFTAPSFPLRFAAMLL